MSDAGKHVFHLGSAFGYGFVAPLLASAQGLVGLGLALDTVFKTQSFEHGLPLPAGVALVGINLLARVVKIQHFVKVVPVILTGCTRSYASNEAMLVIYAHAEFVAKVTLAMLFGMRGICLFACVGPHSSRAAGLPQADCDQLC